MFFAEDKAMGCCIIAVIVAPEFIHGIVFNPWFDGRFLAVMDIFQKPSPYFNWMIWSLMLGAYAEFQPAGLIKRQFDDLIHFTHQGLEFAGFATQIGGFRFQAGFQGLLFGVQCLGSADCRLKIRNEFRIDTTFSDLFGVRLQTA